MNSVSVLQRNQLLDRVAQILACPDCGSSLIQTREWTHVCSECAGHFEDRDAQYRFCEIPRQQVKADWLNRIKESVKRRLKSFYPTACGLISPVFDANVVRPFLKSFDTQRQLVADLGCGTTTYREDVVCVDGVAYPNVHVVANLESLPFQDNSLSGLLSVAVLEHVRNPPAHVAEMQRVLEPGGRVLCFIPFMQGFHASPNDYTRYTKNALYELFGDFEILHVRVGAGPTSALLWILQEWLALALSFGSVKLYRILLPLMWILSPLKLLDLLLARHPAASVIASGHYVEARKLPAKYQSENRQHTQSVAAAIS